MLDRNLKRLKLLDKDFVGLSVDRLAHGRQTATRALRDRRDAVHLVGALLHNSCNTLGIYHHAEVGAAILMAFMYEANHSMLCPHSIFQRCYFFPQFGINCDMRDAYCVSRFTLVRTDERILRARCVPCIQWLGGKPCRRIFRTDTAPFAGKTKNWLDETKSP